MKFELIIVRYGEIALKGKETRNRFENVLVNNIRNALQTEKIVHKIKKERGRIYIFTDQIQNGINVLQKVFGITSVSPAVKVKSDMDSMSNFAVKIAKENNLTEKTSFALRVTRTGSHSYSSQDVAVKLGNDIVNATAAKVDLTNPFFKLFIEIRQKEAFFFVEKIRGIGGMPLNTQGNVLSLVDTYNSILAAWYLMRRGCKTVFACLDESYCNAIESFSTDWYASSDVVMVDSKKEDFYKTLNKIGVENNCEAIVTGFVFDDISEIKMITEKCNVPVLHPLIAMEEDEIKNKCKEIGLKI